MFFSIALLIIAIVISLRAAPKEKAEDAHIHGAGQIGVLAAIALFGVDYFGNEWYIVKVVIQHFVKSAQVKYNPISNL